MIWSMVYHNKLREAWIWSIFYSSPDIRPNVLDYTIAGLLETKQIARGAPTHWINMNYCAGSLKFCIQAIWIPFSIYTGMFQYRALHDEIRRFHYSLRLHKCSITNAKMVTLIWNMMKMYEQEFRTKFGFIGSGYLITQCTYMDTCMGLL